MQLANFSMRYETRAGTMPLQGLCIPRVSRVVVIFLFLMFIGETSPKV
jgi:hypothetical protein